MVVVVLLEQMDSLPELFVVCDGEDVHVCTVDFPHVGEQNDHQS